MSQDVSIQIHLRLEDDHEGQDELRERIEARGQALAKEFPEVTHLELSVSANGASYEASAHVTGKDTEVACHADASDVEPAADKLLDRVRQQLRRTHDKRIFSHRRDAQKRHGHGR